MRSGRVLLFFQLTDESMEPMVEKVSGHGFSDIFTQFFSCVGLGGNHSFAQRLGDVAGVGLWGDFKDEFGHSGEIGGARRGWQSRGCGKRAGEALPPQGMSKLGCVSSGPEFFAHRGEHIAAADVIPHF